jgi:hypothetical protein
MNNCSQNFDAQKAITHGNAFKAQEYSTVDTRRMFRPLVHVGHFIVCELPDHFGIWRGFGEDLGLFMAWALSRNSEVFNLLEN